MRPTRAAIQINPRLGSVTVCGAGDTLISDALAEREPEGAVTAEQKEL